MQDAALNFLEVFVLERSSIKHKLTSSGLPETLLKTGTWQWKCCDGSPPPSSKADSVWLVVLKRFTGFLHWFWVQGLNSGGVLEIVYSGLSISQRGGVEKYNNHMGSEDIESMVLSVACV
jgi:hypothetical protein